MIKIQQSNRVKEIENKFHCRIEDLLYQLHCGEDMMHREIGRILSLPRPTVTRWFNELDIPTQSCRRLTDKNLTSWLYKTGQLKKKPRYNGPDRRTQRTKTNVNVDFFKTWSPRMAYILGFFAADGGMFINSEGSKYIQFVSTDREILVKIKELMGANHKIGIKKRSKRQLGCKRCYLIQIGSKEMYEDLLKLGFTPNKECTLKFPEVPNKYLSHFVRGHFDGDGSLSFGFYKRKARNNKRTHYFVTSFTSGSKTFLKDLSTRLYMDACMSKGYLGRKSHGRGHQLSYGANDSRKLFRYIYKSLNLKVDIYLKRKYNKFSQPLRLRNHGDVVQPVRTSDCRSEGRGSKARRPRHYLA